jgi:WD40 repeat protein
VERPVIQSVSEDIASMEDSPDGAGVFSMDGLSVVFGAWVAKSHGESSRAEPDRWSFHSRRVRLMNESSPFHYSSIAISSDRRNAVFGSDREYTILWDLVTGKERIRIKTDPNILSTCVAFSPDSRTLVTCGSVCQLWDVETGKKLATLNGQQQWAHQITFMPNGEMLAIASADKTVKLWDVTTGSELASLQGHAGEILAVAFSPDGKTLASGGDDGTVRLWDVATHQELIAIKAHRGRVYSLAFAPDGTVLASGGTASNGQGEIFLWPPAVDVR